VIYKEILDMVSDSAYNKFIHGLDYDGLKSTIVECATKIYIAQMQLEKEKLQQEYDDLYEGHDKLAYDWAKLKKENKELRKKCSELLAELNKISSEPLLRKMTIAELKERGFLRNESK
jgi:chromosome segregation ATPase